MTLISLFNTALTSIIYGIIVTATIMAMLYFILKSISRNMVHTPVFYITGIIVSMLLIVQFSLMIGAIQAKDAADTAEIYLTQKFENKSGSILDPDARKCFRESNCPRESKSYGCFNRVLSDYRRIS